MIMRVGWWLFVLIIGCNFFKVVIKVCVLSLLWNDCFILCLKCCCFDMLRGGKLRRMIGEVRYVIVDVIVSV